MHEGRLEEIRKRIEGHDSGAYHDASDMAVGFGEMVSEARELVEEVESLRGRLEAVCDVLSDAEAYGAGVDPGKVLEAVRGEWEARGPEVITFWEIVAGDLLRVSFPPRGGMSDNWSMTHSRVAIAYFLWDGSWMTTDHQVLVARMGHEDAVIERLKGKVDPYAEHEGEAGILS